MPSGRVIEAQTRAELAAALHRREELQRAWAVASYTSSAATCPESVDVELAKVDALIVELEERLALAAPAAPAAVDLAAPQANDSPAPASATPVEQPEFLDTRAAATLLGMTPKALESLRARGRGPAFVQIGRSIRYRREELLQGVPHGSRRGSG
ncbi:MAG TPA: helix-turn-helix domain-containing protein [Polyangiaceae bacterium]|nr:helix-turn-helix domain-containing protein [Polyangiaceae bacterium]